MLAPFCRVVLKSGPFRIHFQHSGAKLRGFEQNTDIIKFWLSYSMTANIFLLRATRAARKISYLLLHMHQMYIASICLDLH